MNNEPIHKRKGEDILSTTKAEYDKAHLVTRMLFNQHLISYARRNRLDIDKYCEYYGIKIVKPLK